jgi:SAM-dependent methyltransferase
MADQRIHSIAERFAKRPEYYHSDRTALLRLLPDGARRILDVGCGAGRSWEGSDREVCGIEFDPEAAERARPHLREVHVGDVERMVPPWPAGHFDCLLFADVLEHLYDPWGVVLRFRPLLRQDGHLLLSVPNVRHYKVLGRLLRHADFGYQHQGILDVDHVRFFARRNVEWLLAETGFEVVRWSDYQHASAKYRIANRLLCGALGDFLAKQFMVLARPRPGFVAPVAAATPRSVSRP